MKNKINSILKNINSELILILFVVAATAFLQFAVADQRLFLYFFYLPVLFAAYNFGKHSGALSALLSVLLVISLTLLYPERFHSTSLYASEIDKWLNIGSWGCFLILTGYLMGILYERQEKTYNELRGTYRGVLNILSHFIARDSYTQNHSYRVSCYAQIISRAMNLPDVMVEDIRLAGLLHDLGKLKVSAEVIHKAMELTEDEYTSVKEHPQEGVDMISTFGGPLKNIVPLILFHHEWFDGSGYFAKKGNEIPLGASILSVSDAFDAMTTDRSYRKAKTLWEAKEEIERMSGMQFDPRVVETFVQAFKARQFDNIDGIS